MDTETAPQYRSGWLAACANLPTETLATDAWLAGYQAADERLSDGESAAQLVELA